MPSTESQPYLTKQFSAVMERLAHAQIGVFTFEELKNLEWAFRIADDIKRSPAHEYRLYRHDNDKGELLMAEHRDTKLETDRLRQLEALADKAGV